MILDQEAWSHAHHTRGAVGISRLAFCGACVFQGLYFVGLAVFKACVLWSFVGVARLAFCFGLQGLL